MRIALVGDICCNFEKELAIAPTIFSQDDLILGNLEFPLTYSGNKANKAGPSIKGDVKDFEKFLNAIKNHKLFLSLANNHIMDYGADGLNDSIVALEKNKIEFDGISKNNNFDYKIIELNGKKIAVICFCEKQFGISQNERSGVNFADSSVYKKIKLAKENSDLVILSIHASQEMNLWPYPELQKQFRSYIDAGANIIHGHHSHVPQGYEKYENGFIFYGLGNFLVNPKNWLEYKNTLWSWKVSVDLRPDNSFDCEVMALELSSQENILHLKKKPENEIAEYRNDCNAPLHNEKQLQKIWQDYCLRFFEGYYKQRLFGKNLNKLAFHKRFELAIKLMIARLRYEKRIGDLAVLYHFFSCDSHKNLLETVLGILCGEITDIRDNEAKALVDKYFQL